MALDTDSENPCLLSVSISKIIPKTTNENLFSYKQCFIGISLDNPVFNDESFEAILYWIADNFEQCLVVVGDYLSRFNETIINGLDENRAASVAKSLGDLFIQKTQNLFERFPNKKIRLTRWQSHLETQEYKKSKAILDDLFLSDPDFQAAVEKDAFDFVKRQMKRNRTLAVSPEDALKLSCEYLLEEIAVFSALSEQGWHVELYPGSELHVLVEIVRGNFVNVPQGLKERISVQLKICENRSS